MSKHTPGHNEIIDNAIDWLCDAPKNTDQWERGQELKKIRPLLVAAPEMLEMLYTLLPCAEESDEFNKPSRKLAPLVKSLIAKAEGK